MLVPASIIIDSMREFEPIAELSSGDVSSLKFEDVRIVYDNQCAFDKNVLYILRTYTHTLPCTGITFISAIANQPNILGNHLIRVSCPFSAEELCAHVGSCIRGISNWSEQLSLAIFEGCDAQHLLDLSVDYLNNPCVILNGIFDCIAISNCITERDELYWDIKMNGRPSTETMLTLSEHNKIRKLRYGRFSSGLDYRISTGPTSFPEIYVDIKTEDSLVLAFNLRFSHTEISPGAIDIIGIFLNGLQRLYELQVRTSPNTGLITLNEYLFPRILNGDPDAIHLAKAFEPFKSHYVIATSATGDVRAMARRILETMHGSYLFSDEDNYYIFIPVDLFQKTSAHYIEYQEKQLQNVGELFSATIGVSGPHLGCEWLNIACRQALSAINLHEKALLSDPTKQNLFLYRDVAFADMVSQYRKENPLYSFAPVSYAAMKEHDEKYNTNYCAFVKTYIVNGCNSAKTAQQLFLHKNSVIYRIEKIKERFQLDITSVSEQLRFLIAFFAEEQLPSVETPPEPPATAT